MPSFASSLACRLPPWCSALVWLSPASGIHPHASYKVNIMVKFMSGENFCIHCMPDHWVRWPVLRQLQLTCSSWLWCYGGTLEAHPNGVRLSVLGSKWQCATVAVSLLWWHVGVVFSFFVICSPPISTIHVHDTFRRGQLQIKDGWKYHILVSHTYYSCFAAYFESILVCCFPPYGVRLSTKSWGGYFPAHCVNFIRLGG